MENDIYSAPEAELTTPEVQKDLPLANRSQRFINMLIDSVGYMILAMIVGFILGVFGVLDWVDNINDYLFGLGIMMLYFVPLELIWGRTLGKLVTGTKVVSEDGEPVSIRQTLGRTLVRFVPFEAFSFLGGQQPRGWHDSWSKTKVVSIRNT